MQCAYPSMIGPTAPARKRQTKWPGIVLERSEGETCPEGISCMLQMAIIFCPGADRVAILVAADGVLGRVPSR